MKFISSKRWMKKIGKNISCEMEILHKEGKGNVVHNILSQKDVKLIIYEI